VDLGAIRDNVRHLRQGTTAEVMAVVKGDAYGHGIVPAARAAIAGGATWLGVATLDEALTLRQAGITTPLLAWLIVPGMPLEQAIAADVDLSVATPAQVDEAVEAARRVHRPARLHLKVDTGLGRGGAAIADWPAVVERVAKAQADGSVEAVGVWSHLARADQPEHPTNADQIQAFRQAVAIAARSGINPRYRHLSNSAAAMALPEAHFDLVRPGIAVYGLNPLTSRPSRKVRVSPDELRPAMTLRARVLLVKRVPAGHGVSYGHAYRTKRATTLAVVPLGYADGIPRAASGSGPLLLNGRRYRIAGRVCMDQFVVDVGDVPVQAGDIVTLFGPGDDGEPTADEWAELLGTINYEIVTRIGQRVPRVYVGEAS